MLDWRHRLAAICILTAIFFCLATIRSGGGQSYFVLEEDVEVKGQNEKKKLWVSLSVCYGQTEGTRGKKHFPYLLAAQLAVSLWRNVTGLNVIVQVVQAPNASDDDVSPYLLSLREAGASVVQVVDSDPILGCVLHSQLQRFYAHKLPEVKAEDVIAISDVDVFPAEPALLAEPLAADAGRYSAWVYQYDQTVRVGGNFAASFIAMLAKDWARVLGDDAAALASVDVDATRWNSDQALVTRAMLTAGVCPLPDDHPQWRILNVSKPETEDDNLGECFHGDMLDCNRDRLTLPDGSPCYFWHFLPYERERELRAKYEEILYGRQTPSALRKTVADVRLELEKILGFRS